MKKRYLISIGMLLVAFIAGSVATEAKTTRKKSSRTTTTTTSGANKAAVQVLYTYPEDQHEELNLPVEKITINRSARTVKVKLKGKTQEKVHRIDWIDEDPESPGYNFVNGGGLGVYLYDGMVMYNPDGFTWGYYDIDIEKSGLRDLVLGDEYKKIIGHSFAKKERDINTVLTFKNDVDMIWQGIKGGETQSIELKWEYNGDGYLTVKLPDSRELDFYFNEYDPSKLYLVDEDGRIMWDYGPMELIK